MRWYIVGKSRFRRIQFYETYNIYQKVINEGLHRFHVVKIEYVLAKSTKHLLKLLVFQ